MIIKKLISSIFLILICSVNINGQSISKNAKKFILNFHKKSISKDETFFYIKGLEEYELNKIINYIEKLKIKNKTILVEKNKIIHDSLIISKEEKIFLIESIKKQNDTCFWNEILIPNSIIIPNDTITAIFNDKNKGWSYYHKKYGKRISSFSIPIFFRNNKLCAFYFSQSCGSLCGKGSFVIYKKRKSNWIAWFSIYDWVS